MADHPSTARDFGRATRGVTRRKECLPYFRISTTELGGTGNERTNERTRFTTRPSPSRRGEAARVVSLRVRRRRGGASRGRTVPACVAINRAPRASSARVLLSSSLSRRGDRAAADRARPGRLCEPAGAARGRAALGRACRAAAGRRGARGRGRQGAQGRGVRVELVPLRDDVDAADRASDMLFFYTPL